jgi:hypothetical protein
MRKALDPMNYLNLKYIKQDGDKVKVFIPINDKILSYFYNTSNVDKQLEKDKVLTYNDEILNFHIDSKEDIIITGKANKAITLFDKSNAKLKE